MSEEDLTTPEYSTDLIELFELEFPDSELTNEKQILNFLKKYNTEYISQLSNLEKRNLKESLKRVIETIESSPLESPTKLTSKCVEKIRIVIGVLENKKFFKNKRTKGGLRANGKYSDFYGEKLGLGEYSTQEEIFSFLETLKNNPKELSAMKKQLKDMKTSMRGFHLSDSEFVRKLSIRIRELLELIKD
jgi:hypothetical protein